MSVKDVIKNQYWNWSTAGMMFRAVFAALIAALLLGILIFLVYKKFYAELFIPGLCSDTV